jgi:outer membrane protein assembly factor BamB
MINLKNNKISLFLFLFLTLLAPATIKWKYTSETQTNTDPIIVDNKIYIFSINKINCIRNNGNRIFTKELNFEIAANPIYDKDSKKFFVPAKGGLYQIESDGYISESFLSNETFNKPIIYESLMIVTTQEGNVYIFDKGKIKNYLRKVEIGEGIGESTIVVKGKAYIITKEGNVYTIDPLTGSKVKFLSISEGVSDANPTYVEDRIFFSAERFLYSFYLGGIIAEKKEFKSWINSINYGGEKIYVGTNDGIYILSKNGTIENYFETEDAVRKKVTTTNSTIYVPSNSKKIYALLKNASKKWEIEVDDWPSSGAYQDGVLYYITRNGTLYSISTLNCIIEIPKENGTISTNAFFSGKAFADSGVESVEITTIPGDWQIISREENWKGRMIISGFNEGKIPFQCRIRDREGNVEQEPYFTKELNYVFSEEKLPELDVNYPRIAEVGKLFKIEILDEEKNPYEGATIKFDKTTIKTDEKGIAFLSFKDEGKKQISISAPNYREKIITINVTKGLWEYLTYVLIVAAIVVAIYIFIKSRKWR